MCASGFLPNTACNLVFYDHMGVRNVALKKLKMREALEWYDLCDGKILYNDGNWYDLLIEPIVNEYGYVLIEE